MDEHSNELHLILVYIGLVTVILFLLLVIWKLTIRCRKMLNDDPVTTRKALPRKRSGASRSILSKDGSVHCVVGRAKYFNRANSSISRQTTFSSLSSSSLLIGHYCSRSSSQPLLSPIPRTCQYKQQYSLPISVVWNDEASLSLLYLFTIARTSFHSWNITTMDRHLADRCSISGWWSSSSPRQMRRKARQIGSSYRWPARGERCVMWLWRFSLLSMPLAYEPFLLMINLGDSVDCGDTSVVSSTTIVIETLLFYYSTK